MNTEYLVEQVRAGGNKRESMEQLYLQILPFIRSMAFRFCPDMAEDLQQEAFLALHDIAEKYDPAYGVKFLTYAEPWFRQHMKRYLDACGYGIRLPAGAKERLRSYRRFCDSYQAEHGCQPSEDRAAAGMGLTVEQIRKIRRMEETCFTASLDAPTST